MATLSSCSSLSSSGATAFHHHRRRRPARATVITCRGFSAKVRTAAAASATATTASVQQSKECSLPTWAEFELGKAPVYWKTMNGLPPSPTSTLLEGLKKKELSKTKTST